MLIFYSGRAQHWSKGEEARRPGILVKGTRCIYNEWKNLPLLRAEEWNRTGEEKSFLSLRVIFYSRATGIPDWNSAPCSETDLIS